MLSNTCKYGIRAVVYLAINEKENQKLGIKTISKELDLPAPFLGKILQSLVKSKMLDSTKGPNGGFTLGRSAYDISLYDIVNAIDGDDIFNECLIGMKICINNPENEVHCPFRKKSHHVRENLIELFKSQSIGDFADGIKNADVVLNI